MTPEVQWLWNASPLLLWTGGGLFLLYLGITLFHLKQVPLTPYRLTTEGVKFLGACLLLLTLMRPEIHTRSLRTDQARMAVVLDRTDSMGTRDVETSDELITREEGVERLRQSEEWAALAEEVELEIIEMGHGDQTGRRMTDLGRISTLLQEPEGLSAVLVVSDGGHNADGSPLPAWLKLSERDLPVFSVGVGSTERLPDLALSDAVFPSYSIRNETMVVPFTVRNSLNEKTPVQVHLLADGERVASRQLDVGAGAEQQGALRWTPRQPGSVEMTVRIDPHPAERLPDNNEQTSRVEVRETRIRVLIVDSLPRWEIRFLRNALHRDPGVSVDTLFYHPGLAPQSGPGLLSAFPEEAEAWSEYDVVFIGDVGQGEGELTLPQLESLSLLVREQGSGLVFLPGPRGGQLRFAGTPLEALMPVELDPALSAGVGSETPMGVSLTRVGKPHMLTQLAADPARSQQIWSRLPGFHWYAGVARARVGAEVLATHRSRRNDQGRIPLIATRDAGNGHVLFMGTDGAWRWRRGVEDLYHYRFWGQVVRWMAHKRNMFGQDGARFFLQPERPEAGQEVTLTLHLRGGRALAGEVPFQLRLRHASGQVRSPAVRELEGGGTYQATFRPEEPGEVTLELLDENDNSGEPWYQATFRVEGGVMEQTGEPLQLTALQQAADLTGGDVARISGAPALLDRLRTLPRERRILSVNRLWQQPWWVVLLFTFFGLYWILRKRKGWI
jgi:uncharacterized membrane protein